MSQKEAKARIKINNLLEAAGWRFFHDENGRANIQLEPNVKITQQQVDALREDFESTKNGFIDFLLLYEKGFPFIVLEPRQKIKTHWWAKNRRGMELTLVYKRRVDGLT